MSNGSELTLEEKEKLEKYDGWLKDGGPAALVIRETLEPVEGSDGVFFPPTYAAAEDKNKFAGGYNIDTFPDGSNICIIDSVGSQANRIEPLFAREDYKHLVPQIVVDAGHKKVNILEAGHRAGDAIVRCSELRDTLQVAFKEVLQGNATKLAKIAPTSLVFGVWDSRDTQAKLPRLVASTIRARNVKVLTRSANYLVQQQLDYTKEGILPLWKSEKEKELYSKRGFLNALASASHGGVLLMENGSIRRDATLGLAALRLLSANNDEGTLDLRRYIFGLALVALTAVQDTLLRQGCDLVPSNGDKSRVFEIVYCTGKRESCSITHEKAKEYAKIAADRFIVGENLEKKFMKTQAEKDIKGDVEKLKGEVISIDLESKKFNLKVGKEEVGVTTDDSTSFLKGKEVSTFECVVIKAAKVEIELANSVAVKVTGRK